MTYRAPVEDQRFDVMAKVKARYITPRFPAWTAIGVSRLLPDRGLTEIKIIARAPLPAGR